MISLKGSRITDILPACLGSDPEIQAFSHAVGRQIERLCELADACRTYAAVNILPDRLLDVIAAELKTPAYSEDYPVETKRALVGDTLVFHMKMGTPEAVNRAISAIFGEGRLWEWFEYGGEPYHFKVVTTNTGVSGEMCERFIRVLDAVKNARSVLDEIIIAAPGSWNYVQFILLHTWGSMGSLTWNEASAGA